MTTQARSDLKARKADYQSALLTAARSLSPRAGFFVEPIYREIYARDPEGQRPAHEAWLFVIDGSETELEEFHRNLIQSAVGLTEGDSKLRDLVDIETIQLNERPDCLLRRFDF